MGTHGGRDLAIGKPQHLVVGGVEGEVPPHAEQLR